ncbi:hypothetical protein DFH11DRAFT_1324302 [Phellopilus nigrolimitatus]|nr:hypothetical protein DFH11DRAFT_1324302 [Phellopilus nigrolimitatus]
MLLRIGREGGLSIADLPPEILRLIFAYLKWNGSDPETPTFFNHAWRAYIRSIKSLVLVCRLWCTLTTPILYSFVYLRDVGQLSALVRTLQEDRLAQPSLQKRHDCWIKHLYIMFYIPPSWYEVCRSDLLRLFVSCSASVQTIVHEPNLQYQICRDFSFFKIIESKLLQYPLPDPRTLRVDILTPARCLSDICSHSLFPALRELRLDISLPAHHILARKITEKVILPRLEVLVCDVSEAEEFENVEILIKYCFLPKLRTCAYVHV